MVMVTEGCLQIYFSSRLDCTWKQVWAKALSVQVRAREPNLIVVLDNSTIAIFDGAVQKEIK